MRQEEKNINNLIFIGGIHGVGKGTICQEICKKTKTTHLIASDILKWEEISDIENKNVDNIKSTQDRLIKGLRRVINKNELYLLDGHFCLFNSEGKAEKIPQETFTQIHPKLIVVATTPVNKIQERLANRDGKIYNLDVLNEMQIMEVEYAKRIASTLSIPFVEIENGNYQPLLKLM